MLSLEKFSYFFSEWEACFVFCEAEEANAYCDKNNLTEE